MRYINILFSQARVIRIKDNRLQIIDNDGQSFLYPLEDINCMMLENRTMSVSVRLLSECAKHGIAVFCCDEKHMPSGIFTPFNTHYQKPKVLKMQLDAAKPLQKRLWQALIRQKIKNQSEVLFLSERDGADELRELSKQVHSGDTGNIEAVAARKYFIKLFDHGFSRDQENFANACLNYTYAILRGAIARTLVAYGFEPSLGLNHASSLNAFNLADDLIEPFRPVADLLALSIRQGECESLTTANKQDCLRIFQTACLLNGQVCSVNYAIEKLVQSLKQSLDSSEVLLDLPQIIKLHQVRYE